MNSTDLPRGVKLPAVPLGHPASSTNEGHESDVRTPIQAQAQRPDQGRFQVHRAAEALLPQPPLDWVVEDLFLRASVSLVVGDPGSKKTYSMLDLGVCVALGIPWLGHATRKCPVLFVDEESGQRRINLRLGDIMRAHSAGQDTGLQYVSLARLNLRDARDADALEALLIQVQAGIVIIDAMADIMPGADENSVKDVQPVFLNLRRVADRAHCAIIMIHHTNRNGGIRGSSAALGASDVILKVESKPGTGDVHFGLEKNRDGQIFDFDAAAGFLPDLFVLSPSTSGAKASKPLPVAQAYVLSYLAAHGATLLNDMCSHADTCSYDAARKATYTLAQRSLVARVDAGGSGTIATYDLTEKGKELAAPLNP